MESARQTINFCLEQHILSLSKNEKQKQNKKYIILYQRRTNSDILKDLLTTATYEDACQV